VPVHSPAKDELLQILTNGEQELVTASHYSNGPHRPCLLNRQVSAALSTTFDLPTDAVSDRLKSVVCALHRHVAMSSGCFTCIQLVILLV